MTDISKEAVERLANVMDAEVQRLCGAKSTEAATLRAQYTRIAELEAQLATARDDALREAIGECCPHEDDDSMDTQAKTQCADAIAALLTKEPKT